MYLLMGQSEREQSCLKISFQANRVKPEIKHQRYENQLNEILVAPPYLYLFVQVSTVWYLTLHISLNLPETFSLCLWQFLTAVAAHNLYAWFGFDAPPKPRSVLWIFNDTEILCCNFCFIIEPIATGRLPPWIAALGIAYPHSHHFFLFSYFHLRWLQSVLFYCVPFLTWSD